MTTIFWHEPTQTLYADSRTSVFTDNDDAKRDGSLKIMTLGPDDYVPWDDEHRVLAIAGAGRRALINWLAEQVLIQGSAIEERLNRHFPPFAQSKDNVSAALIVVTTGPVFKVHLSRKRGALVQVSEVRETAVAGSGSGHLMLAYQFFGLPPLACMQFARAVDPNTGGEIHSIVRADGQVSVQPVFAALDPDEDYNAVLEHITKLSPRMPKQNRQYHHGNSTRLSRIVDRVSRHNRGLQVARRSDVNE